MGAVIKAGGSFVAHCNDCGFQKTHEAGALVPCPLHCPGCGTRIADTLDLHRMNTKLQFGPAMGHTYDPFPGKVSPAPTPFNQRTWPTITVDQYEKPDPVNHPSHYKGHPSGIECIQITEHMGFNLGNAVKYIWRCDLKKDAVEDLKKAKWYIDRELEKRRA